MSQSPISLHSKYINTLQQRVTSLEASLAIKDIAIASLESRLTALMAEVDAIKSRPYPLLRPSMFTSSASSVKDCDTASDSGSVASTAASSVDSKGVKKPRVKKETDLSKFLTEGETVRIQASLGGTKKSNAIARFSSNHLTVIYCQDLPSFAGKQFDSPSGAVDAFNKALTEVGLRNNLKDCSYNGWLFCFVTRDGKESSLDDLRTSTN
jgi:hypothetical protein